MSENILKTLRQLIQDVIAPDVRELKARMASQEKQIEMLQKYMDVRFEALDQKMEQKFHGMDQKFESMDQRFHSMDQNFQCMDQKHDARFRALLSAISESRPQTELSFTRAIGALTERVATLEAQSPRN